MSRLRLTVTAAILLVLTGCGSVAGAAAASHTSTTTIGPPVHRSLSAPPTPSPPPAPAGTQLTAADTGATVSLTTGQRLTVDLAPGPGAYAWDRPRLTGSALRLVTVTGGYPSRSPVQATFVAVAPGTAELSAASDWPCLHTHPRCLLAQRGWNVQVVVKPQP